MAGEYLLDTNIVIALFAGDAAVVGGLAGARRVLLPSIVVGELYYGAHKSSRATENVARVGEFASANTVLSCTRLTAEGYGLIKLSLQVRGRPIPDNDIWIAAIARQHGLTLVSRDAHFAEIEGLDLERW